MKSLVTIFLFFCSILNGYGQNFLLTSKCELSSDIKIWLNSQFIGSFTLKPYEEKWINLPKEGWVWVEGYADFRAAGKNPVYTKKEKGKLMKFVEHPRDYYNEFNGYEARCPCELIRA
jgi:hypothetical protein